jgi:hypothetical protein
VLGSAQGGRSTADTARGAPRPCARTQPAREASVAFQLGGARGRPQRRATASVQGPAFCPPPALEPLFSSYVRPLFHPPCPCSTQAPRPSRHRHLASPPQPTSLPSQRRWHQRRWPAAPRPPGRTAPHTPRPLPAGCTPHPQTLSRRLKARRGPHCKVSACPSSSPRCRHPPDLIPSLIRTPRACPLAPPAPPARGPKAARLRLRPVPPSLLPRRIPASVPHLTQSAQTAPPGALSLPWRPRRAPPPHKQLPAPLPPTPDRPRCLTLGHAPAVAPTAARTP